MKKSLDSPQKIKTTLEELEVLSRLKEMVEWVIVKRWINRYIENLRKVSFCLLEDNPSFKSKHAELAGQAIGLRTLVKYIEKAGKKMEEMEKRNE